MYIGISERAIEQEKKKDLAAGKEQPPGEYSCWRRIVYHKQSCTALSQIRNKLPRTIAEREREMRIIPKLSLSHTRVVVPCIRAPSVQPTFP